MYPVSTPSQIAHKFWNNLVNEINEHDLFQVIFSLPHWPDDLTLRWTGKHLFLFLGKVSIHTRCAACQHPTELHVGQNMACLTVYWTEPTGLCRSNWLSSVHSHWCEYMFKKCKTLCCPEQYKGKCVLIILL